LRLERGRQTLVREQRWIDPSGEVAEILEGGLRLRFHLSEHALGGARILPCE
jgi:hypothetical protein